MQRKKKTLNGPSGGLYMHSLPSDPEREEMARFIVSGRYKKIAIFGAPDMALAARALLFKAFMKKATAINFVPDIQVLPPIDHMRNPEVDLLIFTDMEVYVHVMYFRYIVHTCQYAGDVIIPLCEQPGQNAPQTSPFTGKPMFAIGARRLTPEQKKYAEQRRAISASPRPLPPSFYAWPFQPYDIAEPVVSCCFPCSGTGRFQPPFVEILERMGWTRAPCNTLPLTRTARYINCFKTGTGFRSPPQNDFDNAFLANLRDCDYNQFMFIHVPVTMSLFRDIPCAMAVLMRDPRDIVTSVCHYPQMAFEERPEMPRDEKLSLLLKGLTRYYFIKESYVLLWPPINEMIGNYLSAADSDNMHIVRFEDLHYQGDASVLKDLVTRMGLYPNPLMEITDADFEAAAYLGSFEYQTQGKRKRGDESPPEENSSPRKGIVGDWRNYFTPSAVSLFKDLSGDGLVRLGYEQDTEWSL